MDGHPQRRLERGQPIEMFVAVQQFDSMHRRAGMN
jgi:hypothetical protein